MRPAALALAGGTAIVAAVASWELRSRWLARTLQVIPISDQARKSADKTVSLSLPDSVGGYRRVSSTEGGRQQIYVKGRSTVSLFLPSSTAADIAAAPGWSMQKGADGSIVYTLTDQDDHCAVAFTFENQLVVLASRIKPGRLIELADHMMQAMRVGY
ncbi:MAG: hypothetical protein RLZ42_857 [Armatimonadota bacterium]